MIKYRIAAQLLQANKGGKVKVKVVTITEYDISEAEREGLTAACEYWADNGTGETNEYYYHADSPFDTLDHFHGAPETSTIKFSGNGKTYTFKEA